MTDASIETLALRDLDQAAVTAWSQALGDPDWFLARRLEALAALAKLERPNHREEAWRVMQPLLDSPPTVHPYVPGSWGPDAADAVTAGFGGWRTPWQSA